MNYFHAVQAKRRHALATSVAISLCSGNAAVLATEYNAPMQINAGERLMFVAGDTLTQAGSGHALIVSGTGALASGDGLALRVTGQVGGGAGFQAADGGRVILRDAEINTADATHAPTDTGWATGVGSLVQLDRPTIQAGRNVNGGGALNADNGGRMVLNDGSIAGGRVGETFELLAVTGAGSVMEINRTQMRLSGRASLTAANQGRLVVNAATLDGYEGNLRLTVSGRGAQLDANSVSLANARYDISHGGNVRLQDSSVENSAGSVFMLLGSAGAIASAEVHGGSFTATGAYVLNANNNSRFTGKRLKWVSKDAESAIWVAVDTSTLALEHARIETSGQAGSGNGILATGGTTTLFKSSIDTQADKASAVRATGSTASTFNRVSIEDSQLHSWGAGGAGVLLGGGIVDMSLRNVQIATEGAASPGILHINAAKLTVAGGSVDTRGANSAAFRSYMTREGEAWSKAGFDGGHLRTADGPALWLQGANHEVSLRGTQVNAGAASGHGVWLRVSDTLFPDDTRVRTGQILLKASGAQLQGDVRVDSSTAVSKLLFSDSTQFTGALLPNNGMHVAEMQLLDGSTWNVTGTSELGALAHQGIIAFVAPATADRFKQVQISGDYVGMGGRFVLNTALSGDQSRSDKVHITGNSTGAATLQIVNAAGAGAATRQGIQVVQVDGSSDARFTLDGRAVAGAYEYFLHQGGQDTPDDGDWYLRSSLSDKPVTPDPAPRRPTQPITRPEVGVYQTNQLLAAHMFDHSLDDRLCEADFAGHAREDSIGQICLRAVRNQLNARSAIQQLATDSDIGLLQLNADLAHGLRGQGRFRAGVMGGMATAQTHVGSIVSGYQAKGQVKGQSLGIYGTWFARADQPTGLYVDTWLQYGSYDEEVRGGYLQGESYGAHTWTGSIETGYSWRLHTGDRSAAYLQPQLQLLYTDYRAGSHVEANSTRVEATQAAGLSTRLGVRLYGHASDSGTRRVQPFLALNWEHRADDNIVSFNGVAVEQQLPRELYEARLGAEAILGGGWTGWGHVAIQNGGRDYRDVEGQVSLGYRW